MGSIGTTLDALALVESTRLAAPLVEANLGDDLSMILRQR